LHYGRRYDKLGVEAGFQLATTILIEHVEGSVALGPLVVVLEVFVQFLQPEWVSQLECISHVDWPRALGQYLHACKLDLALLALFGLVELNDNVFGQVDILKHGDHLGSGVEADLLLNLLDKLLLSLLVEHGLVEQSQVQVVLAVLDEGVPLLQTAEKPNHRRQQLVALLCGLALAVLDKEVVQVGCHVVWGLLRLVHELHEGKVAALLELDVGVEAELNLSVHARLEVQQALSELDGILDILLIGDDGFTVLLDVAVHLLDDAGQIGLATGEALVEQMKII